MENGLQAPGAEVGRPVRKGLQGPRWETMVDVARWQLCGQGTGSVSGYILQVEQTGFAEGGVGGEEGIERR